MRTVIALLCLAGTILIMGLREPRPERPKALPRSSYPLVIRTSFESRAKWEKIRKLVEKPVRTGEVELKARVDFVNEVRFRDLGVEEIVKLVPRGYGHPFVILADEEALLHPEMPLLVVDLQKESRGRAFRALPGQIQTVENNLSIGSVDFEHFERAADGDGVYRGLPSVP